MTKAVTRPFSTCFQAYLTISLACLGMLPSASHNVLHLLVIVQGVAFSLLIYVSIRPEDEEGIPLYRMNGSLVVSANGTAMREQFVLAS